MFCSLKRRLFAASVLHDIGIEKSEKETEDRENNLKVHVLKHVTLHNFKNMKPAKSASADTPDEDDEEQSKKENKVENGMDDVEKARSTLSAAMLTKISSFDLEDLNHLETLRKELTDDTEAGNNDNEKL